MDRARISPNISAMLHVKVDPHILMMVRWVAIDALEKGGFIAPADWPGSYCITDVGRAALVEGMKDSEMM
jgi:hypothetical protein